jgi:hypothetical protein
VRPRFTLISMPSRRAGLSGDPDANRIIPLLAYPLRTMLNTPHGSSTPLDGTALRLRWRRSLCSALAFAALQEGIYR